VTLTEANLKGHIFTECDLKGANLRRANLSGVDLRGSDLRAADLTDTLLSDGDLRWTDLRGADLTGSTAGYPRLPRPYMVIRPMTTLHSTPLTRYLRLTGSLLEGSKLDGASLEGADLRGACLPYTLLLPYMDV